MGYSVLSKYRSELMGAAMLWVMLFHAADLTFPIPGLDLFRAAGFGGVDIFILLSAMGLSLSLSRLEQEYGAFLARRGLRLVGEHSLEIYLLNVSLFSETALLRSWLPLGTGPYYFLAFFLNILLGILLHRGVEAGMRRIQARRAD